MGRARQGAAYGWVIWKGFLVEVPFTLDWRMCRIQAGGGLAPVRMHRGPTTLGVPTVVLIRDPPTQVGTPSLGRLNLHVWQVRSTGGGEEKRGMQGLDGGRGRRGRTLEQGCRGADLARAEAPDPPPPGLALSKPLLLGLFLFPTAREMPECSSWAERGEVPVYPVTVSMREPGSETLFVQVLGFELKCAGQGLSVGPLSHSSCFPLPAPRGHMLTSVRRPGSCRHPAGGRQGTPHTSTAILDSPRGPAGLGRRPRQVRLQPPSRPAHPLGAWLAEAAPSPSTQGVSRKPGR